MRRWVICPECHGEGKHAHAIDGNGITASEWAEWEPEERETYLAGGYDRTCEECDGSGKVKIEEETDEDEDETEIENEA